MSKKMKWLAALFAFGVGSVHAGPLTVSTTFQAGTPAKASEVNQNFQDVKAAVDDNDSRITANAENINTNVSAIAQNTLGIANHESRITANEAAIAAVRQGISVYANGTRLGAYITLSNGGNWPNPSDQIPSYIWIMSDKGYLFPVVYWGGWSGNAPSLYAPYSATPGTQYLTLPNLYYAATDCSGQAYIKDEELYYIIGTGFLSIGGTVFRHWDNTTATQGAMYLPKSSSVVSLTYASYANVGGACTVSSSVANARVVYPNDPAITAVASEVNYQGPITLGY